MGGVLREQLRVLRRQSGVQCRLPAPLHAGAEARLFRRVSRLSGRPRREGAAAAVRLDVLDAQDQVTPDRSQEMPEPIDAEDFAGPHPTCREFVAQLAAWGFTERGQEHVHTVFRDPHGGTRRVLRSQLGRADPATVDKAARLAGVTPAQFWAGPPGQADPRRQPSRAAASRAARPRVRGRGVRPAVPRRSPDDRRAARRPRAVGAPDQQARLPRQHIRRLGTTAIYDPCMSSHSEPSVESLTAEIRVLQVGSKPVTLSAARQLDHVDPVDIKPFGRVRIDPKPGHMIEVIGLADGILARSSATERIADIKVSRHSCLTGYHTVWQQ